METYYRIASNKLALRHVDKWGKDKNTNALTWSSFNSVGRFLFWAKSSCSSMTSQALFPPQSRFIRLGASRLCKWNSSTFCSQNPSAFSVPCDDAEITRWTIWNDYMKFKLHEPHSISRMSGLSLLDSQPYIYDSGIKHFFSAERPKRGNAKILENRHSRKWYCQFSALGIRLLSLSSSLVLIVLLHNSS